MTAAALILTLSLLGQSRTTDAGSPDNSRYNSSRNARTANADDTRSPGGASRTRPIYADEEPTEAPPARYSRPSAGSDSRGSTRDDLRSPSSNSLRSRSLLEEDEAPPANDRLAPVARMNPQMGPPEIIAEALSDVDQAALVGDPLRLSDAIKAGRDRAQQIKIAQVYWRLAVAEADYHFSRDAVARFRDATNGKLENPALRAGRCALRALQRDAEALVIRAQNDLLAQMGATPGSQVSLAVDKPHAGGYNGLDSLYGGRAMPPRGHLVLRIVPVRVKAIEEHADGILASLDAIDDTIEQYRSDNASLTTLLIAFERLWKERKAFTAAVGEYNQDLAEFVLGAAPPNESPTALVARLIKTDTSVRSLPAATTPSRSPARLASPPIEDEPAAPLRGDDRFDRGGRTFRATEPPVEEEPELKAPRRPSGAGNPFGSRTTSYRFDPEYDEEASQRTLWRALVDVDTPLRTQRLTNALNMEDALPRDAGRACTLSECLRKSVPANRRAIVGSYWRAREAAAICQLMMDEANDLTNLSQAGIRIRKAAGGPETMVRLRALQKSVSAAITDAKIGLMLDQFELTRLCGGDLAGEWLLPATAPHGGRYSTRVSEQPIEFVRQKSLDQLATLIALLHLQMEDHASTVVYADQARAMATRDPGAGPEALDTAMALTERQASHTVFFLRATTKYNLAIADYVLALLPVETSIDRLEPALVLSRPRTLRS